MSCETLTCELDDGAGGTEVVAGAADVGSEVRVPHLVYLQTILGALLLRTVTRRVQRGVPQPVPVHLRAYNATTQHTGSAEGAQHNTHRVSRGRTTQHTPGQPRAYNTTTQRVSRGHTTQQQHTPVSCHTTQHTRPAEFTQRNNTHPISPAPCHLRALSTQQYTVLRIDSKVRTEEARVSNATHTQQYTV